MEDGKVLCGCGLEQIPQPLPSTDPRYNKRSKFHQYICSSCKKVILGSKKSSNR